MTARYGRPTSLSESLRVARYCGDGRCAAVGANFAELSLRDGWRLELTDGGALVRLKDQKALADADRSIRRTDKTFF